MYTFSQSTGKFTAILFLSIAKNSVDCHQFTYDWVHFQLTPTVYESEPLARESDQTSCSEYPDQATGYATQHNSVHVPSQDKFGGLRHEAPSMKMVMIMDMEALLNMHELQTS